MKPARPTMPAALAALTLLAVSFTSLAQDAGRVVYEKTCVLCHGAGVAGAPRLGFAADWKARLAAGKDKLYTSALKGTPGGMPMKGGNLALSDGDIKSAVDFMVASVGGAAPAASTADASAVKKPAAKEKAPAPAPAKVAAAKPAAAPAATAAPAPAPAAATAPAASAPAEPPPIVAAAPKPAATNDPNAFNRLLAAPGARNPPPVSDGIHDPENPGTLQLQHPAVAFSPLQRTNAGNRVNWVQSVESAKITPRWDREDPNAAAVVMDLNIVREVKGSMPDVVYPHKQHTEWLDCAACHPQIFIPQKGANQISMASIMLGQKCGVCHGKVAFPVSECRLCHSKAKEVAVANQDKGAK